MNLKEKIRTVPHWPSKGIMFRDITSILQDPQAYQYACDSLCERYLDMEVDKIVGIDARGFIFGSVIAYKINSGFIPVRKKGKLPAKTINREYTLEYGSNSLEIHTDAINPGDKIVIIDDLLATGGTAAAATSLVEELGGQILECAFVVELPDLQGRQILNDYKVHSLVEFAGE